MRFRLTVHVNPSTSRRAAAWKGDFLKVNLTAPPENGRANEELIEYVAKLFGVDPSGVSIVRGRTARQKELRVEGLDRAQLVRRLRSLESNPPG